MTITTPVGPDLTAADSDNGVCLRIGVVLDSLHVPAWVAKLLADLRDSKDFTIVIIGIIEAPQTDGLGTSAFSTLLFQGYTWADRRVFQKAHDAWAVVDIVSWVQGLSQLCLIADRETPYDPADVVIRELRSACIDVILDFSSQVIPDNVVATARYGVWSCHEGVAREYTAMPPFVAEIYENNPVSGTVLQCRTREHDAAKVLYRGTFATDRNSLCATRNISAWNAAAYVVRRLYDLHRFGWAHLSRLETSDPCVKKAVRSLGNWTTLCLMARLFWRFLVRRVRHVLFDDRWCIAIRATKGLASLPPRFEGVRFLGPNQDHSYADPFLFRRDGRTFLFLEEICHPGGKGTIAYTELDAAGNWHEPRTVLRTDYHLSYPFLFEWEDEVYLLPESAANRTLELYRALDFPGKWTLDRVVMDEIDAVDATITFFEGRYWLYVNLACQVGQYNQELHLFYSETPLGPWTPHARNPVVSDVQRSRPAGSLLTVDGKLVRPSQDCSTRYGYAITWNLVETLTPTEYRERVIGRLDPDWLPGNCCTHTFARDGDLEVIDFRYPVWRKAWRTCFGVPRCRKPPTLPQAKGCECLTLNLAEVSH